MEKHQETFAWIVLLLSVIYLGGHLVVAKANGWISILNFN